MLAGFYFIFKIVVICFVLCAIVDGLMMTFLAFKQLFMYLTNEEYRYRYRSYHGNMLWFF